MPDRSLSVACLCEDSLCTAEIALTAEEAETFEAASRFPVALGHPLAEGDRVVRRTDRYALVETAAL